MLGRAFEHQLPVLRGWRDLESEPIGNLVTEGRRRPGRRFDLDLDPPVTTVANVFEPVEALEVGGGEPVEGTPDLRSHCLHHVGRASGRKVLGSVAEPEFAAAQQRRSDRLASGTALPHLGNAQVRAKGEVETGHRRPGLLTAHFDLTRQIGPRR